MSTLRERTIVNECYILQTRIGEDSFTEHWIATAIFSATRFLLRFVKHDASEASCLDNLRLEARRSYCIQHDSITDFIEVESFQDRVFISSEYHDEKNLLAEFATKSDWRLDQICLNVIMLARGLDAFHDQNLVFGNLNAENVLVSPTSDRIKPVKIQKPGLLAMLPCISGNVAFLAENYAYIAPEYKTRRELCAGSDIYSLGVHLVRFFTGTLPFPDSEEAIKTKPAALRYATNALLRRGIPEELVRITLKALMPEPGRRYNSCADIITDLRYFLNSPRNRDAENETSGHSVPGDIPRLPESRSQDEEQKTTGSFDYFNSSRVSAGESMQKNDIAFPIKKFSDQAAIERLEKQELTITAEEAHWSIDDYIAYGRRAITADKNGTNPVTVRLPKRLDSAALTALLAGNAETGTKAETGKTDFIVGGTVSVQEDKPQGSSPATQSRLSGDSPDPSMASNRDSANHESATSPRQVSDPSATDETQAAEPPPIEKKISWNYFQLKPLDILGIISGSAKNARKGIGSFTYIHEPSSPGLQAAVDSLFQAIKHDYLFLDIGTCARFGRADIVDFLRQLRLGLALALRGETEHAIRRLARLTAKADDFGVFKSAPLGRVLYGADEEEINDPIVNSQECRESIVRSLAALSRKKRPLLLVIGGGESIQRELHDLFALIATEINELPLCVLVFFEHIRCESWHALSAMEE